MRGPGLVVLSLIVAATAVAPSAPVPASEPGAEVTGTWESKLHVFGESVTIEMRTVDGAARAAIEGAIDAAAASGALPAREL